MKIKLFLAALAVALSASIANAAVEPAVQASSFLEISKFLITKSGGGAVAVPGDLIVASVSNSSVASADMNGVVDLNVDVASVDVISAYSNGVATASGTAEGGLLGALPGLAAPFALADVEASGGNVLTAPGATVSSLSAAAAPNVPFVVDNGVSSTSSTLQTLVIRVGTALDLKFSFDALLDITLDNLPAPPGSLSASASFGVTLLGTGITVGGSATNVFSFAPAVLNTGLISSNAVGTFDNDFIGSFVSPVISLAPGTYSFQITQGTTASVGPIVPEPMSVAVWGVLAVVAGLGYAGYSRR